MWMTLAKIKYRKKPVLFQGNIFSNQMSRRAKLQSGYRCYHVDLMDTKKLSRKDILFFTSINPKYLLYAKVHPKMY